MSLSQFSGGSSADRATRRARLAVYLIGVAILLLLTADKYSFGESAQFAFDAVTHHLWQVWAFAGSAVLVAAVLMLVRRAPSTALALGGLEVALFIAVNATLYARDGYLRFVDWDYGHSQARLYVFYAAGALRVTQLLLLNRLRRA
jgi:hypothetical protein